MEQHRLAMSIRRAPLVALVLFASVIPVASLVARTFQAQAFTGIWSKSGVWRSVWFSIWMGSVSTLLTLAIAMFPTWLVSRREFRGRRLLTGILTVPFVLPTVVVGSAFIALLPSGFDRSLVAVFAAHVFFNVSIVVRTVGPSWRAVDSGLHEAASLLGSSAIRRFCRVTWPLLRPAMSSSAALVMLMTSTSFGIIQVLAPPGSKTVETEIFQRTFAIGDISGATALALAQTAVMAFAFAIGRRHSQLAIHTSFAPRAANRLEKLGAGVIGAIFVLPILAMVLSSLRSSSNWTFNGWRVVIGEPNSRLDLHIGDAIGTSLTYALATAAITTSVAILYRPLRARAFFSTLPLATSGVVVGLGVIVAYDTAPFDFRGSSWIIPVIHASVATPFAVRAISNRRELTDRGLDEAAAMLGASSLRRFTTIELPLLRNAAATAVAMSAAISLGEFGATSLLARSGHPTLPLAIAQLLSRTGSLPHTTAMALSTVLLALTLVVFAVADWTLSS